MKKRREKLNQEPAVQAVPPEPLQAAREAEFAAQLEEMIRAELESPAAKASATQPFRPVGRTAQAAPERSATRTFAPPPEEPLPAAIPQRERRGEPARTETRTEAPARRETAAVIPAEAPEETETGGGRRRRRLFSRRSRPVPEEPAAEAAPELPEPAEPESVPFAGEGMPERSVPVEGVELEWGQDLSARAVQECDRLFTSFLRTLVDRFAGLEEELYFYRCALYYIDRFEDRGVTYVWPEILPEEENALSCRNLRDLLLLTESMYVQSVIPNDVAFGKGAGENGLSGMLVTGKNNSGKTVYLRSIGTAVLLAQCGLPVPAEEARISVRRRIFTTFAKAEGELVPQSSAGRFEEEVAEIAGIIRAMEPDSLLLLNETFQTTAYDEGADGMVPILTYLAGLGCGFIFVTHLTRLVDRYRAMDRAESGVTVMRTSDDPRTRYKIGEI